MMQKEGLRDWLGLPKGEKKGKEGREKGKRMPKKQRRKALLGQGSPQ